MNRQVRYLYAAAVLLAPAWDRVFPDDGRVAGGLALVNRALDAPDAVSRAAVIDAL